jgi:hypothetical protein
VNGKAYASVDDGRLQVGQFIETDCNRERLHSAPGYNPPVEFEGELRSVAPTPSQDAVTQLMCLIPAVQSSVMSPVTRPK